MVIRRLPRATARMIRLWAPWTLAGIFAVLAVGSLSGRLISSQLEGSEAAIAEQLGAVIGFDVQLGRVQGRFLRWHPVLEIEDLCLLKQGSEVIRVGRGRIELDIVETLLRGHAVASALVLEEVVVAVDRDARGAYALRRGRGGTAPDPEPIVSFLYHSDYVDLRGAEVQVYAREAELDAPPLARIELRGGLVNEGFSHRGHLRVDVAAEGSDAPHAVGELHLDLDGDPLDAATRAGVFLLDVQQVGLVSLGALLGTRLPPLEGALDRLRVRATVDPRAGTEFTARASAERMEFRGERAVQVRNLRIDLDGHAGASGGGDLRLRQMHMVIADEALAMDGARLGWRPHMDGGRRWFAELGPLDAGSLARLARSTALLNERVERWVTELDPEAGVTAVRLVFDDVGRIGAADVRVRDLSLRGYRGVPRVRGMDASAVVYEGGAWIDIDSGTFYLQFPGLFDEGWRYDSATGRINLRFDPAGMQILSDRIEIQGPQGRAIGRFAMHLPRPEEDRRLSLMLGLENADAAFTEAFLPAKLNPGLRAWLARSVRAGRVDRGALVINGAVKPSVPLDRTVGMAFDLRAGRLAFDPAWPPATSLDARVQVAADGVRGEITGGRLAGLEIQGTSIRVTNVAGRSGDLELEGTGRGDGGALIEFLRRAPLGEGLDFLDGGWDAVGPVDLDFALQIPLDGRPLQRADIDADVLLDRLSIGQANLTLQQVAGRFAYRHPGYLTSADARAQLFGGPIDVRLAGNFGAGAEGLVVEGDGIAEGRALADWLRIDVLARMAGSTRYDGRVQVRPDGSVTLRVDSPAPQEGATGLITNLPAPVAAPAAAMSVAMDSAVGAPTDIRLAWGPLLSRFQLVDGAFERGTMALDAPLGELPPLGLSAVGRASALEVGAWLDAIDNWQQDAIVLGHGDGAFDELMLDFDLAIDAASWEELRFGAATMRLSGFVDDLTLGFAAEQVVGRIRMPPGEAPLDVRFERLALPLDPEEARQLVAAATDAPAAAVAPAATRSVASAVEPAAGAAAEPVAGPAAGPAGEPAAGLAEAPAAQMPEAMENEDEDEEGDGDEGLAVVARLLADLDPGAVPRMDIEVASLSSPGEDLGRLRFDVRPWQDGLRLVDIEASGRGLAFGPNEQGKAQIDLTLVPWPSTHVVGRLSGEDAERVLSRFGFAPTLDAETFSLDLDVAWDGLLDEPMLESVAGSVALEVERGRFVQIEAGGGPSRVVGLFNFAAIARRMRLDFSDLYKRGIAFEEIDGVLAFADGHLVTSQPVRMEGPGSRFVLTGDLELETLVLDAELVVTLPVSNALPWYAAYAALVANPLAGAGVLMAERIFRDQIEKYSSARYRVSGTVDQPEVVFDTIFENELSSAGDPEAPTDGAGVEGPLEDVADPAVPGPANPGPAAQTPARDASDETLSVTAAAPSGRAAEVPFQE